MRQALICIILLIAGRVCGQHSSADRKYDFIKSWGILKYFDPIISSGKIDADSIFLESYPWCFDSLSSLSLPFKLDNAITCQTESNLPQLSFSVIPNYQINLLASLILTKQTGTFYSISGCPYSIPCFRYEKKLPDVIDTRLRYLILARVWNIFRWLSPDRKLDDGDWSEALKEAIKEMEATNDSLRDFDFILQKMVQKSNDPHANIFGGNRGYLYDKFCPDVNIKIRKEEWYINDSTFSIIEINNISTIKLLDSLSPCVFGKTREDKSRKILNELVLPGDSSSLIRFKLNKGGQTHTLEYVRNLSYADFVKKTHQGISSLTRDSLIYINLSYTQSNRSLFSKAIRKSKLVILDLREYPLSSNASILRWVTDSLVPGYEMTVNFNQLGTVTGKFYPTLQPRKGYPGCVIILTSSSTISMGEYFCLILKRGCRNAFILGNQTSGAVGESATVPLYSDAVLTYTASEVEVGGYKSFKQGISPDFKITDNSSLEIVLQEALKIYENYGSKINF